MPKEDREPLEAKVERQHGGCMNTFHDQPDCRYLRFSQRCDWCQQVFPEEPDRNDEDED